MEKIGFEGLTDRAVLRFLVVSEVKRRRESGQAMSVAVAEAAAMVFYHPKTTESVTFAKRTIYRLLKDCKESGIAGLENTARKQNPRASSVLSDTFVNFVCAEKTDDPYASTREIIERAKFKGVISPQAKICRTTVYRLCRRLNLPISRSLSVRDKDMRRFQHPHRMMMVLVDGKHFRAGITIAKRVVFTFLDDFSRKALACVVGSTENTQLFMRGLDKAIRRFGFASAMYLDRGPGFNNGDTASVLANLDVSLILGRARYPEAHGKIERYHLTLINDLLRSFPDNPEIDASYEALELRIQHYLDEIYNNRAHGSLEGKTPNEVFFADERKLRIIADVSSYESSFIQKHQRRVSKDNIVSLARISYEVPTGYALRYITVCHNALTGRVFIFHEGKSCTLAKVDLAANALGHRGKIAPLKPTRIIPQTAATMHYNETFKQAVDKIGNFIPPTNAEDLT